MLNEVVKQEFSKLERMMIEAANDLVKFLKVLKKSLGKHDSRTMRGLHYRSTSKYCLKVERHDVKDMVSELRHVAKRINKSKEPSKSEVVAARSSVRGAADAINDLISAGGTYDQNRSNGQGKGGISETVEALVKAILHDNFSGFTALENQISIVEEALAKMDATDLQYDE
ncbi:hypothetical protein PHMEG_00032423 [Phytophthora megakarya]|uniref:Uncharacterized protein n=1 Tax=Phytophthora megakarya TaxID=4795 RepID=A0A225UWF2_9STRA|nr:hypothetical protein PHMEG_00032423 [Phytophthora megakarya]